MAGSRPKFHKDFGKFVEALRLRRGWSVPQAVQIASGRRRGSGLRSPVLTEARLNWLEKGRVKNPDPEVLRAVGALYGVPYEVLVSEYVKARYGIAQDEVFERLKLVAARVDGLSDHQLLIAARFRDADLKSQRIVEQALDLPPEETTQPQPRAAASERRQRRRTS